MTLLKLNECDEKTILHKNYTKFINSYLLASSIIIVLRSW